MDDITPIQKPKTEWQDRYYAACRDIAYWKSVADNQSRIVGRCLSRAQDGMAIQDVSFGLAIDLALMLLKFARNHADCSPQYQTMLDDIIGAFNAYS